MPYLTSYTQIIQFYFYFFTYSTFKYLLCYVKTLSNTVSSYVKTWGLFLYCSGFSGCGELAGEDFPAPVHHSSAQRASTHNSAISQQHIHHRTALEHTAGTHTATHTATSSSPHNTAVVTYFAVNQKYARSFAIKHITTHGKTFIHSSARHTTCFLLYAGQGVVQSGDGVAA